MKEATADPHADADFVCPDTRVTDGITALRVDVGTILERLDTGTKEFRRMADAAEEANHRTSALEQWKRDTMIRDKVNNEWLAAAAKKDDRASGLRRWQWGLMAALVPSLAALVGAVVATVP